MATNSTSVLVVGAGPTGLLMACELARYGVPFRIIDKKSEPTKTSNAAGIQTRTLELLADIGILDRFLNKGVKCKHMNFRYRGKKLLEFDFSVIDSLYKYILFLPQSETEKLLEERLHELGGRVERNVDFIESGESIICDWIIGCDGAHSLVRQKAGIVFPGQDIEEQFIVADGEMQSSYPSDEVNVFADDGKVLAVFPLGDGRYRLAANLLQPMAGKSVEDEKVRTLVDERSGKEVSVQSIHWASPFWIHSKMANAMRKERIFLAGDAAHIHSPVGGQGMNTGLQDAYNLIWKLAYVIQGKAPASLLDSYQVERQQVIKTVVSTSERLTKAMISTNYLIVGFRNLLMKFINSQSWIKKKICMRLTQLDICYQGVGARFRDVLLEDGKHLHDYLDKKKFNIVLIGDASLEQITSELVHVVNIRDRFYGADTAAVYIVRPDMYVCYQSDQLEPRMLMREPHWLPPAAW